MYVQLMVVAFAVFWLLRRAFGLASAPLDQIVKTLGVKIPRAATISVDNITDTTVHIHWDKPAADSDQKIANFLLFINGAEVGSLSGRDAHSTISGLLPSTKYRIDLVTVNHKSYKAKSRSVYIKTKSRELQRAAHSDSSENPLENPEALFKLLTDNSGLSVEKIPSIITTPAPGENPDTATGADVRSSTTFINAATATPNGRRGGRSRSNTVSSALNADLASTTVGSINLLPDPKAIVDIEELRYYLESRQEDLHIVLSQQTQILQEFKEQEAFLSDERQKLRERKKLEDNNRALVKSQIKNLDELRRNTELKKAKQEAVIQTKQKLIEKMTQELDEWSQKIEDFEREKVNIERSEDKVHEAMDTDVGEKKLTVKELQSTVSELEDEIKQLLTQKKQRELNRHQLHKIFRTIGRHTDGTGLIDQEGVQNLELLKSLEPALWETLNQEIELDSQLEARWRAEQQRAVSNCEKAESTLRLLQSEFGSLKQPQTTTGNGSGALSSLNFSGSSLPITTSNSMPFPQMQTQLSNNNSSSNSFVQGAYFSGSVSPPTANAMLSSQSVSPHQTSPWNSTGLSLSFKPTSKLSLNTNHRNIDMVGPEELESPSINHFLPTDLIGEEFNDMTFPMSPEKNSTTSEDIGSGQGSTPKNANASLLAGSSAPSFVQNMHFPTEFSNLSSRSIFHNEFGMGSQGMRQSLDNPSSPPLPFQHEFLSGHNSPATNNNDVSSIFSGGNVDILPTFTQTSADTKTTTTITNNNTYKNAFSPRRLSSVFGFGNRNKLGSSSGDPENTTITAPIANGVHAGPKHSKFFHRSQNSDLDPPTVADPPLFNFEQPPQTPGAANSAFNILDVWSSPFSDHDTTKRPVKEERLEATRVWSATPADRNTSAESKFLGAPSSANSLSSQAMSDANTSELGPVVQLTNTNKSGKSVKSKSSTDGFASNGPPSNPSPGFFRRKSNLLSFGHNKNVQPSVEKSPVKQHTGLSRMESPTRIDSHDDGEVEEFNPSNGLSSSKKLFSRRMSFNTNIRKQSSSSHETDSPSQHDQSSGQSSTTTNGRSLVRKLSLFGNKIKESNVFDEHDDEDETR